MKYFESCLCFFFGKHNASSCVCLYSFNTITQTPAFGVFFVSRYSHIDTFDFEKARKLTQVFAGKHFQSVWWNIARERKNEKKNKRLRSIYYISRKRSHIETPKKVQHQLWREKKREKKCEKHTQICSLRSGFFYFACVFLLVLIRRKFISINSTFSFGFACVFSLLLFFCLHRYFIGLNFLLYSISNEVKQFHFYSAMGRTYCHTALSFTCRVTEFYFFIWLAYFCSTTSENPMCSARLNINLLKKRREKEWKHAKEN